ncbi:MAG: cytochrome c3 family protein [Desulfovibrionaceae bacterium]|nr:cytochrome c3 family protein [Desulfovibrionaceae bacterium]
MGDRQHETIAERKKHLADRFKAILPFLLGFAVAVILGWILYPILMHESLEQPVQFSHRTHVNHARMDCSTCHYLRQDGSFHAWPSTADCAQCHNRMIGTKKAEQHFFTEYVQAQKEVPWLTTRRQPDNVFFSHAVHSKQVCGTCHAGSESNLCSVCHGEVGKSSRLPDFERNRLTGYGRNTMKMQQCEACHANPNHRGSTRAGNACFVCHK